MRIALLICLIEFLGMVVYNWLAPGKDEDVMWEAVLWPLVPLFWFLGWYDKRKGKVPGDY